MIFDAPLIALIIGMIAVSALLLAAARTAWDIMMHWNRTSGSPAQIMRERKTYLVATLLANALTFQLLLLFMMLGTFDRLAGLITGAMCGAGVFAAHWSGYPALLVMIVTAVLAGVWVIVNRLDNAAIDAPLIRIKYTLVLVIAPLMLAATGLTLTAALNLDPDVITTCCGTVFAGTDTVAGDIASLPPMTAITGYATLAALTLMAGAYALATGRTAAYAMLSAANLPGLVVFMISALSLFIYAMPTHHCPFDVVQKEYGFIGYVIYAPVMAAGILGIGAGIAGWAAARFQSLETAGSTMARRLVIISLTIWAALYIVYAAIIALSPLRLF